MTSAAKKCGSVVSFLACLVPTGALASDTPSAPVVRGAVPFGAIDVLGSVTHLKLDDTGGRLLISTVRYPDGGRRLDELHLHELAGFQTPGGPRRTDGPVPRLSREIENSEAVALSRDGEWFALGCGIGLCIHGWGGGPEHKQLAAGGRPREIGALALRPDVGLLVAAQRDRMEILSWELTGDVHRRWAVAGAAERFREWITPRFHGRPSWVPRWVGVSPDGQRVASIRDDGTTSLWNRTGQSVKTLLLPRYADLDPAFAPDGGLVALRAGDGRLAAVDVESERVLLAVEDPPSRSVRRAALLFGLRGGYLAVSGSDGVVLHTIASGEPAAVLPMPDPVWRIAMSANGRVVAVATQRRITLWRLTPGSVP
jgi:hypothetical protein